MFKTHLRLRPVLLAAGIAALTSIGIVVAGWAAPSGAAVVQAIQKHINSRLSGVPNKPTRIEVEPDSEADAARGKIGTFMVIGKPAILRDTVRLSELYIKAKDVTIDVPKLFTSDDLVGKSADAVTFKAVITDDDLTYSLSRGGSTRDMGLKVTFVGNKVHVSGTWKLGFLSGPIETTDALLLKANGREIHVAIENLKINGHTAPESIVHQFEKRINPLIETKDLPLSPQIKTLKIEGDKLLISS